MGQVPIGRMAVAAATALGMGYIFDKVCEVFGKKPERPPPPPPDDCNISQEDLIQKARKELNMDARNNYNYALCGPRGTGKSTFINCIQGLDDPDSKDSARSRDEEKAAAVGLTETTDKPLPYKFSAKCLPLQHVVLWDMPGSGTLKHPSESYYEDKVLYAFDCLLITSESNIFGKEQISIINKAQKYRTPVVLLITRMDQAVENEVKTQFKKQRNYHPTLDEYRPIVKQIIEQLKSYAQRQQTIVPRERIFVISAIKFRDYLISTGAGDQVNADEDLLLSGEMAELIQLLTDEAARRRH